MEDTKTLVGNLLVAQSGGPTPVINASLAGVISSALQFEDDIEEIYGAINGVEGILNENLIDLAAESQQTVRLLNTTPGAALGSCRYKLRKEEDFARILEVFKAHNIRYFHYIGGNDSQDSSKKIADYCAAQGYELRVIGVPKTIDNDLPVTDHCPGYGSTIKYIATTVRELTFDSASLGRNNLVTIVEVMGRGAGWIAAGSVLAKRKGVATDAPHIVLLPEVPFNADAFAARVQEVLSQQTHCVVVAAEGLKDAAGNFLGVGGAGVDAFGHPTLGGVCEFLKNIVEGTFAGVKTRCCRLGHVQRTASHCGSLTDINEAFEAGAAAVKAAVAGESGKMIVIVRDEREHYSVRMELSELDGIANCEKVVPAAWIGEDGMSLNPQFAKYALPLIVGEPKFVYENGLPKYAELARHFVDKKCAPYNAA